MAERLQLVLGRAGSGKTRYCHEKIKEVQARRPGQNCVLLVPDQASYTAERELAAAFPAGGYANVEVLGFGRLMYRVFNELGTDLGANLSRLGQQLVLRHLLQAKRDDFRVLNRAARQAHFAEVLATELNDLQLYRVQPEDLLAAAGQVSTALADKLHDTAAVYAAYLAHLREHFPGAFRHELLLAEVQKSAWLAGAAVFIDGFHGFTPRDAEIIRAVAARAQAVTVTLTMDPEREEDGARETSVFHRQWLTRRWLKEIFPQTEEIRLTQLHRYTEASGLARVEADYFAVPPRPAARVPGLTLTEAHSPAEETDAVLGEVCRLVREEGYRYRDILILLRSHEQYTDLLVRACERFEVPYFTDMRRPMQFDGLTVLLGEAVRLAVHGWQTDGLLRLLKTGLTDIERSAAEELELFCREFGIERREWYSPKRWEYRQRYGIEEEEEITPETEARWERIDAVRRHLIGALEPLAAAFAAAKTVRERAAALFQWLDGMGVRQRLAAQAEGLPAEAYRARLQVYGRVVDLLEELVQVAGDETWPAEDFAVVWSDGLRNLSYSLIPPTLDHVTITTIDRGYSNTARAVFVVGQNEGVFPARPTHGGLWSDTDRAELAAAHLDIGPDSVRAVLRERLWLYLAWTRASERLYLSYALGGEEGEALEPAFAVTRLAGLGYAPVQTVAAASDPSAGWVRPRQSLADLPAALAAPQPDRLWYGLYDWALGTDARDVAIAWTRGLFYANAATALTPALGRELYAPQGTFRGSVTAFETYRQCPFRFYARYGLGLDEDPEQELSRADFGTYLHAGLHRYGERLLAEQRQWRDIKPEEIPVWTAEITEEIAPRLGNDVFARNAYNEYIRHRLDVTFAKTVQRLAVWARQGKFATVGLEERFRLPAGKVGGTEFIMVGSIDRLDIYEDPETGRTFYLVIDYKTGHPTVDMAAIYYGLRLQLATYLYAAMHRNGGKGVPAGIMYVYVHDERQDFNHLPSEAERAKQVRDALKAQGYFLAERKVLGYIDAGTGTEISFLPVRFNQNGAFRKDSQSAIDEDSMRTVVAYIAAELPQICAEILSGEIAIEPAAEPNKIACKYCPYGRFCGFDRRLPGNRYRRLPKLRKEEALAKMKEALEGGDGDGLDA